MHVRVLLVNRAIFFRKHARASWGIIMREGKVPCSTLKLKNVKKKNTNASMRWLNDARYLGDVMYPWWTAVHVSNAIHVKALSNGSNCCYQPQKKVIVKSEAEKMDHATAFSPCPITIASHYFGQAAFLMCD